MRDFLRLYGGRRDLPMTFEHTAHGMRSFTPSILLADDDPGILTIVSRLLQLNGYIPLTASDGPQALRVFAETNPSLVILDVLMPGMDGIAVCTKIRSCSETPVIMLTALEDESDAARALAQGADDYIRKPFGANELMARVRAVLRRSDTPMAQPQKLQVDDLSIDEASFQAVLGDTELCLSKTEFALLVALVKNRGRVLTHDQLLERVWGSDYIGSHHVLQVAMSRLRQKVQGTNSPTIETLSGVGYRLEAAGASPTPLTGGRPSHVR